MNRQSFPIAITGYAFRLPGQLNNRKTLWQFLKDGKNAIDEIPPERWQRDLYHPEIGRAGKTYVRRAGLLTKIDKFDAGFFGISPKEASRMDPQHRVLLETAFEAVDDSGIPLDKLRGSDTAVYVGICANEYAYFQDNDVSSINAYSNIGAALSIAANRISHAFDLHGPSMAVDTACSSGLVAFDQACQALHNESASVAIVASANIILKPETFVGFCQAGMLSPTAQCRAFDSAADGFVRAEGVAAYVIKPLNTAIANKDVIHGVVLATGSNSDGKTQGLSLPSQDAQAALLESVYSQAGIAPSQIDYVECHGTGTRAGDPIEAGAVGSIIGTKRKGSGRLPIGSIKTNIGHTEPVSGLAGLAKALLCIRHRKVPPSLHFKNPNPDIDFDGLNLEVVTDLTDIQHSGHAPTVGVNSFGFGGANAHLVVRGYDEARLDSKSPYVNGNRFPGTWSMVSGASEGALMANAVCHAQHFSDLAVEHSNLPDPVKRAASALVNRRTTHKHRMAFWESRSTDIATAVREATRGDLAQAVIGVTQAAGENAFIYTGNGSQWWAMARQLVDGSKYFREHLDTVDAAFGKFSDVSLVEELLRGEADSRMERTFVAQPALFALQIALTRSLASLGVVPKAVMGHSAGEIAASVACGALSLEEGARLVYERSRLQELSLDKGRMAALELSAAQTLEALKGYKNKISLAAINSPTSVTVSGDEAAIDKLVVDVSERKVRAVKLPIRYPFHSPAMDGFEKEFRDCMVNLVCRTSRIPFYSTVEGKIINGDQLNADYWWRNLRDPVLFNDAVAAMVDDGKTVFVEIGPQPLLRNYVKAILDEKRVAGAVVPTLSRTANDENAVFAALAGVAVNGGVVDLNASHHDVGNLDNLPPYSWQQESHWHQPGSSTLQRSSKDRRLLAGERLPVALAVWGNELDLSRMEYMADHVVRGRILMPATGFVEMVLEAAQSAFGDNAIEITNMRFLEALFLQKEEGVESQLSIDEGSARFSIKSRSSGGNSNDWSTHTVGDVRLHHNSAPEPVDLEELKMKFSRSISGDEIYRALDEAGLEFGEKFRTIDTIHLGGGQSLARVNIGNLPVDDYFIHPCLLDAALQSIFGVALTNGNAKLYLPAEIGRATFFKPAHAFHGYALCTPVASNNHSITANIRLMNEAGETLALLEKLQVWALSGNQELANRPLMFRQNYQLVRDWVNMPAIPNNQLIPEAQRLSVLKQHKPGDFNGYMDLCLNVAGAYSVGVFEKLTGSRRFKLGDLHESGILEKFHKYLNSLIHLSLKVGYLREEGGTYTIVETPDASGLVRRGIWKYADATADITLLMRCGEDLTGVLTGSVEPLSLLFPGKQDAVAEQVYECGYLATTLIELARSGLSQIVDNLPREKMLRILEIGAGTGGTTSRLLQLFPEGRTRYIFSDVTDALASTARTRFSDYPFIETAIVNIENPLDPEEIGGPFDVVIANSVLHATVDLDNTLSNIRGLLADGGRLICVENRNAELLTFVFGQIDGWWLFQDETLRTDSPLLEADQWKTLLRDCGYEDIVSINDKYEQKKLSGSVLIATNPQRIDRVCKADEAQLDADRANAERAARNWMVVCEEEDDLVKALACEFDSGDHNVDVVNLAALKSEGNNGKAERALFDAFKATFESLPEPADIIYIPGKNSGGGQPAQSYGFELISLLQATATADWKNTPQLALVTRGAQQIEASDLVVDPAHTSLWALARCVTNEYSAMNTLRIDFHGGKSSIGELASALARPRLGEIREDGEVPAPVDEIVLTDAAEYHASVIMFLPSCEDQTPQNVALTSVAPGSIENIVARSIDVTPPADDEVQVKVNACGLNFRDLMLAIGALPPTLLVDGPAGPCLGLEFAGMVEATGKNVSNVKVGDKVVGIFPGSAATILNVPSHVLAAIPSSLDSVYAASLPVAGLTAKYTIEHLGRLQKGEKILIHAGAGGVGLAAIQIAANCGAEIFATAGSPQKRQLIQMLGAHYVFDSRSLEFADGIRKATNGAGMDVVLNSLSGDAMLASIDALAPYGRFLDIAKRDHIENRTIGMRLLEHNISHFSVDISTLGNEKQQLMKKLFADTIRDIGLGRLAPLPLRKYPLNRAREAFRFMQQGRHVGKIVLAIDQFKQLLNRPLPGGLHLSDNGSYLITGGLGGIGLMIARWLADLGAKNLVLVGRSGIKDNEQAQAVEALRSCGIGVQVHSMDIADQTEVEKIVASLGTGEVPPLKGVIHGAMVLADCLIANMDAETFATPFHAKTKGAWILDKLTRDLDLDFFVCLSSASSSLGTAGQSNYAAANAYMEGLMLQRHNLGLPGLSINPGIVDEVGYVAREIGIGETLTDHFGIQPLKPADITLAINDLAQTGEHNCLLFGNGTLVSNDKIPITKTHRFAAVSASIAGGGEASKAVQRLNLDTIPEEQRFDAVQNELVRAICRVISISPEKLDRSARLQDIGLDSLMAVELGMELEQIYGTKISISNLMAGGTIMQMCDGICDKLGVQLTPGAGSNASIGGLVEFDGAASYLRRYGKANDEADWVLVAVPYLGAGSQIFTPLAQGLAPQIETFGVEIPGRYGVQQREMFENIEQIGQEIGPQIIAALGGRRLRFYGHSAGGYHVLELADWLSKNADIHAEYFYFGGFPSPREIHPLMVTLKASGVDPATALIEDRSLKEWAALLRIDFNDSLLGAEEFMGEMVEPTMRELLILWRRFAGYEVSLDKPVTLFHGSKDDLTHPDDVAKWETLCSASVTCHTVTGTHTSFINKPDDLVREILKTSLQ